MLCPSRYLVVGVLLAALLVVAAQDSAPTSASASAPSPTSAPISSASTFSFRDFFQGAWIVQRSVVSLKTSEIVQDEIKSHYWLEKENNTVNLIGRHYLNDSQGTLSDQYYLYLEFEDASIGSFKTATSVSALPAPYSSHYANLFADQFVDTLDEDEFEGDQASSVPKSSDSAKAEETSTDLKVLFGFNFEMFNNNGIMVSYGQWNGQDSAYYQFLIPSFDKFTITIYPTKPSDDPQVIVYSGRKVPVVAEKSFFQKYSTVIMIGVFFLFNMFVQRKTRQMQQPPQQAARRGRQQGGATVEEIPDSTAPSSPSSTSTKDNKKKS